MTDLRSQLTQFCKKIVSITQHIPKNFLASHKPSASLQFFTWRGQLFRWGRPWRVKKRISREFCVPQVISIWNPGGNAASHVHERAGLTEGAFSQKPHRNGSDLTSVDDFGNTRCFFVFFFHMRISASGTLPEQCTNACSSNHIQRSSDQSQFIPLYVRS